MEGKTAERKDSMMLRAKEDAMYRLIDYKEKCLIGAGISLGIFCALEMVLFLNQLFLECFGVLIATIIWSLYLVREALNANARIMQTKNCYMELEKDCLVVRQPQKNEHYEMCRIFYDEIEKIVEGSRQGIPEFYVVIRNMEDEERESFILLDNEEKETPIFQVRAFGYDRESFREFYLKLRWNVPGKVRILGTRKQTIWNKPEKKHRFWPVLAIIVYIVPKILMNIF